MDVVINFGRDNQTEARLLMEMLLSVSEGVEARYRVQYCANVATLNIYETVLRFVQEKDAQFSSQLPAIQVPHQMIMDDPNATKQSDNHCIHPRLSKLCFFGWNHSAYKYIQQLDHFLFIEPGCIVQNHGWLAQIEQAWLKCSSPIMGQLKRTLIGGEMIPTRWSRCAVYDGKALRELPLDEGFASRIENPWWPYRDSAGHEKQDNCFVGPFFSAYDVSFDYYLFAVWWKTQTGSNDPLTWPTRSLPLNDGLILENNTREAGLENLEVPNAALPAIVTGATEAMQHRMLKKFLTAERTGLFPQPLSGPDPHPLGRNDVFFNMRELRDRFKGQRCFIMGNGPSLGRTDLSLLRNEYTLGFNRIYLNYEKMRFQPTFYLLTNPMVMEQFHKDIDALDSLKFVCDSSRLFLKNRWNTYFMRGLNYRAPDFQRDLETMEWYEGWTVTYAGMQLAYYLGFEAVILIGVDHYFKESGTANAIGVMEGDDPNHFHPDYFPKGITWQYPDLDRSEQSYRRAKVVYELDGRMIFDATVGGHLDVFPKVDYEAIFKEKQPRNKQLQALQAQKARAEKLSLGFASPGRDELDVLHRRVEEMENSRSWKITRPLRKVKHWLKSK